MAPASGGLLYAPGSALLILGLAYGRGFFVAHLNRPVLKRLGTASFSLYMIHHPILRQPEESAFSWLGSSLRPVFGAVLVLMFVIAQTARSSCVTGMRFPCKSDCGV